MIDSELQKFIGDNNLTVLQAMQRIDANEHGILIIAEESGRLIGSLSDGDVRRYLLSGGRLEDNVTLAANQHLRIAHSYEEAVSLFHKKIILRYLWLMGGEISSVYILEMNG